MKRRVVALLGRTCGLDVLDALLRDPSVDVVAVFTHGLAPRTEGGVPRVELQDYRDCCARAHLALFILDGARASDLGSHIPDDVDLLVSVSWRNRVAEEVLTRMRLGAINLHRGALPDYAGAEPVRRAIEAGERQIAITAHRMTAEIDAGEEIARVSMPMAQRPRDVSSSLYAEMIKAKLAPLYAPLARLAVAAVIAGSTLA